MSNFNLKKRNKNKNLEGKKISKAKKQTNNKLNKIKTNSLVLFFIGDRFGSVFRFV